MNFAPLDMLAGAQQINLVYDVDSTQRHPTGLIITAIDPYWGPGEFMYVKANGAIRQCGIVVLTPPVAASGYIYNATEVPNTANLGRTLAVALSDMASGEFGWVCVGGVVPVNCNASVAADTTFGIAAAGQGGANSAGKQILNARVMAPATTTVVKTGCKGVNGQNTVDIPNGEGWFRGVYISGTGIAAGATVTSISPDGRTATLSANNTAAVTGSLTATYNNATIFYNVAHLNRPFAQGAIT